MIKKNKKYLLVTLLILFISIGFAYLSATLNITGLTNITGNSWNIYFDNIQYVRGQSFEVTAPTTTGTTTTSVSYQVFLPSPGDVYKFNIDVVNGGTIDAMVKVVTDTELTASQKEYASYYVTYNDGISCDDYQLLPKNSRDTLSVMVAYNKDIAEENIPTTDQSIIVTFHLEYEQATNQAQARNHITVVNRQTNGQLSVGDEIALGDEHFYVIDTNDEKTTLLTKYLLDLDNDLQFNNSTSEQKVLYSTDNYWYDNGLKIQYGQNENENDIYDENYSDASGNNYSIVYYVNKYDQSLKNLDLKSIKHRLLTVNEAHKFGCNYPNGGSGGSCNIDYSFIINTKTYWLSSYSGGVDYIWCISSPNSFFGGRNNSNYSTGASVRPVIEIPALDI